MMQHAACFKRSLLIKLALIVLGLIPSATAAERVEISIDESKAGAKIDRDIFGQFAEHLGHGV